MEGQHDITTLEVGLVVQIHGFRHDPPAAVRAMHVPDVVSYRTDKFRSGLLYMDDLCMRAVLDVDLNGGSFTLGGAHVTFSSSSDGP